MFAQSTRKKKLAKKDTINFCSSEKRIPKSMNPHTHTKQYLFDMLLKSNHFEKNRWLRIIFSHSINISILYIPFL